MNKITKLAVVPVDIQQKMDFILDKLNELIDAHNAQVTEEVWPKEEDRYYYLYPDGSIGTDNWTNHPVDIKRKDYTGIYRTEAEAFEAKERIIKAVKGI